MKITVREISPETVTTLRFFVLSIILFIIMYFKGERLTCPPRSCLLLLLFMGLNGTLINNVAQFCGLKYSTAVNASLISSTTPAITAVLAAVLIREKLNLLQWFGIMISLGGTLFLISHGNIEVIRSISFNIGDILFFVSQVSWALYALTSLRVMKHLTVLSTTAWAGLFGALLTLAYATATNTLDFHQVSLPATLSIGYIILGGGLTAMLAWNFSVKTLGASQAAIFANLIPLIGMLTGSCLLGEAITVLEISGAAAILSGVYITTHSQNFIKLFKR